MNEDTWATIITFGGPTLTGIILGSYYKFGFQREIIDASISKISLPITVLSLVIASGGVVGGVTNFLTSLTWEKKQHESWFERLDRRLGFIAFGVEWGATLSVMSPIFLTEFLTH